MNKFRILLEDFWVRKDTGRETYYKVKRDTPNFQRFAGEQLGWKLAYMGNLLKLKRRPAHMEGFMGIGEFMGIRNYCILCAVLMYLKDKKEQEQFLLSELIDYVEAQLKPYVSADWTSFTQRKSLVRVLRYMEKPQILRVHEGCGEAFGSEVGQEVLCESTRYSKYFVTSLPTGISISESQEDFEKADFEGFQESRGTLCINRMYRQLAVCPFMYQESNEDVDSLYLRSQRQWVARYINGNIGGNLDLHRDIVCISSNGDDCHGPAHSRDATPPEIVLMVCGRIQREVSEGNLEKQKSECIYMVGERISGIILSYRREWSNGWSEEYRGMGEGLLVEHVLKYMRTWLIIRNDETQTITSPSAGRTAGVHPKGFKGGIGEWKTVLK